MNTNGVPDSIDYSPIILKGVVYGNDLDTTNSGIRFVIRDNAGGISGGIMVNSFNKNWNYTVNQGDTVMVQGRISQISGWGTIDFLDTLIKFGSGVINAPVNVSVLDESTESNLIKLTNVYVSPCTTWPTSGADWR